MREVKIPGGTLFYSAPPKDEFAPQHQNYRCMLPELAPPKPPDLERRTRKELKVVVPFFSAIVRIAQEERMRLKYCFGRPKWAQSCRGNLRYYATARVAPCERYFYGHPHVPEYPRRRYWGLPYARCDNEFHPTAIDWCSWPCQE